MTLDELIEKIAQEIYETRWGRASVSYAQWENIAEESKVGWRKAAERAIELSLDFLEEQG